MNAISHPDSFVPEIEQDVLGSFLADKECFARTRSILAERHFCSDHHKLIYRAMCAAYDRYSSVTVPIVARMVDPSLDTALRMEINIGTGAYLARLVAGALTGREGIRERAKAVVEQWARLSVALEADRIKAAAMDPAASVADIITSTGQTFESMMADIRRGPSRKSRVTLADAMNGAFLAAEEAKRNGRGLTGITWGLTDLNRLTGGMQKRDLTLIGARPSMGKTTFATSVARAAAKAGEGVAIISLEMDREKVAARMASDIAWDWNVKIPYVDIIRGAVEDADLESIKSACREVDKLPIWIDDQSGVTINDIRVKLEGMLREAEEAGKSLSVLMIDHLGLIRANDRYSGNRNNEIAEMTAALKGMAREYDIAVILLSQLNRSLESRTDKRPQLSDLRDSGAIEQDADTIMFLHREAYYLDREKGGDQAKKDDRAERLADCQNLMEVQVAKQRNGPIKTIELFADMGCAAIRNGARI